MIWNWTEACFVLSLRDWFASLAMSYTNIRQLQMELLVLLPFAMPKNIFWWIKRVSFSSRISAAIKWSVYGRLCCYNSCMSDTWRFRRMCQWKFYFRLFQVLFELELLLRAWKRRTENPLTAHLQREATDQLVSACCSIFAIYIGSVSF